MSLIKIKYSEASNANLVGAFQRLAQTPMNLKLSYTFMKIANEVRDLKIKIAKEYERDLLDKFAKKDKDGKFVMEESNEGFLIEDKEGLTKAEEEFSNREATLTRTKVSLAFVSTHNITLTPADLNALQPIFIDDLELPETNQNLQPSA